MLLVVCLCLLLLCFESQTPEDIVTCKAPANPEHPPEGGTAARNKAPHEDGAAARKLTDAPCDAAVAASSSPRVSVVAGCAFADCTMALVMLDLDRKLRLELEDALHVSRAFLSTAMYAPPG